MEITPDGQMARQTDAQVPLPVLCTSSGGHSSMYQVSFNSLLYFHRYAPDKHNVISFDRVTVLALCTSSDGRLSVYQVSLNSLLYF